MGESERKSSLLLVDPPLSKTVRLILREAQETSDAHNPERRQG
jgi:hypothetical protein